MADKSRGKQKTATQRKKLAQLLSEDVPIRQALVQAGWSEVQAKKGRAAIPEIVLKQLPKKAKALIEKGKMNREDLQHLVIGRLVENTTKGKDSGTASAKVLGSFKDLNLWQPDQLAGIIVLGAPPVALQDRNGGLHKAILEAEG